jgi:hypothetical protein
MTTCDASSARSSPAHVGSHQTGNNMVIAVIVFFVALFIVIAATHRAVNRRADKQLRKQFDAQGKDSETSRKSMRDSGYDV